MLHVLDAQARERPDATWVVVDGAERLTFGAAQAEAHQVAHALVEDLGGPCHVGLFLRNQIEFLPSFYGAQAAGGVAVPLNADSRGLLLQRVIERADVRAIIARGDQLGVLQELDGLGAVELIVVTSPEGALPATRARRARGRVPLVDLRPLLGARARAARQLRDRADPVHVGDDRQLEGRPLPAPLPVPVLGGRLGRAGAHERRRADDAAAAVPRRGAAHHLQLGAARRLHGASEEPLLGALLLAGDRRRRRDVRDHPRDAGGDPAAHRRRGPFAPAAGAVLRAVPAGRRGVRGSASA